MPLLASCSRPSALAQAQAARTMPAGLAAAAARPRAPRGLRLACRYSAGPAQTPSPPPQQPQGPPRPAQPQAPRAAAPAPQQQQQQQPWPPQQQPSPPRQQRQQPVPGWQPPQQQRQPGWLPPPQQPPQQRPPRSRAPIAALAPAPYASPYILVAPRGPAPEGEVYLPRSLLVGKDVVTRTSGRRLGLVSQMYVDPSRLAVASLYLRPPELLLARVTGDTTGHVLLPSLRQIGDVVLVHDEAALADPPADESTGYVPLVGSDVVTEAGDKLGRVRDYLFSPDSGAISALKYDILGIPSLPESLFDCYSLGWEAVVAVGPDRVIVRSGAEAAARLESSGIVGTGLSALANLVTLGLAEQEGEKDLESYRSDPAYLEWYRLHGRQYEQYHGVALPAPLEEQQAAAPPARARRRPQAQAPRALPPPQAAAYGDVLQRSAPADGRQAVPAGGYAAPPPQRQQQQQPYPGQYGQRPPPPSAGFPPQQPQQQSWSERRPPGARQGGALPQAGIPIVDRRPPPAYRRRDYDGGYGERPGAGAVPPSVGQQRGREAPSNAPQAPQAGGGPAGPPPA